MTGERLFFVGNNLLGDCLCTTPTVRAFRKAHPDAYIIYIAQNADHSRILDGNPDIDAVVYSDELAARGDGIVNPEWLHGLGIGYDGSAVHRFDVHALHRLPDVFKDHMARGFARLCGTAIDSVRPVVAITDAERERARTLVSGRYIVLAMHSTSPVVGRDGAWASKDWVFERWLRVAKMLRGWDAFDIVAVGSARDAAVPSRYFRNLYGLPIKVVAAILEQAACVITVESGISHLCHAVSAPTVLIYSHDVPREWAAPAEARCCRVLHEHPRAISSDDVIGAVESVLATTST
jgi:ADP-heptose:LPS heptosyltransferase